MSSRDEPLPGMIGSGPEMRAVYRQVRTYAPTGLAVAVIGETGTGKELVARAIHELSPQARGPFVDINCAALPEQLAEGELFGWERGAFTGSVGPRIGLIEMANGGTLFLDEATSLPPPLQAKLLRVLENREFRPLGARTTRRSGFRIVVALGTDVNELLHAGRMRADFLYRVSSVAIGLPPLRNRHHDLKELANHFLAMANTNGHPDRVVAIDALRVLAQHGWPGNVRELKAVMERIEAECQGELVSARDVSVQLCVAMNPPLSLRDALAANGWNVTHTAKALGITRATVYNQMKRFGIHRTGETETASTGSTV